MFTINHKTVFIMTTNNNFNISSVRKMFDGSIPEDIPIVAYIRVSTDKQFVENQRHQIIK
jgi:hypothetical protein